MRFGSWDYAYFTIDTSSKNKVKSDFFNGTNRTLYQYFDRSTPVIVPVLSLKITIVYGFFTKIYLSLKISLAVI